MSFIKYLLLVLLCSCTTAFDNNAKIESIEILNNHKFLRDGCYVKTHFSGYIRFDTCPDKIKPGDKVKVHFEIIKETKDLDGK